MLPKIKRLLGVSALFVAVAVAAQVVVTVNVKVRGSAPIRVDASLVSPDGTTTVEALFDAPLKVIGPNKVGHSNWEWQVEKTGDTEWTLTLLRDGQPVGLQLEEW